MKSGRAKIGIFQKMRIKNLMGGQWGPILKLDSFTLETSKNHLIRSFLRNGRLRVKKCNLLKFGNERRHVEKFFSVRFWPWELFLKNFPRHAPNNLVKFDN